MDFFQLKKKKRGCLTRHPLAMNLIFRYGKLIIFLSNKFYLFLILIYPFSIAL